MQVKNSLGHLSTCVLGTYHSSGTGDGIPIYEIVSKVGKDICQNLPAAHALTGSDTTSAFFKMGKRTAYSKLAELVKAKPNILKTFGLSDNVA